MDSDSLFYIKSQFYLGGYKNLIKNPLPPTDSPDYLPTVLYTARAHIALSDQASALKLLSSHNDPQSRAFRALASYLQASSGGADVEALLDELRDLCIEVETEEYDQATSSSGLVKVAAATAFVRENELEEALTTLGAGTGTKDIECVALIVHIYLSINRPDLAKKEYDAAKRFADDSLLIQLVEASIGVTVGGSALNSAYHIYDEQASAPGASSNPSVIASRGVAHLLRAHHSEAEGDFSEALKTDETHADALVGSLVVADLGGKKLEAEGILSRLQAAHPSHPLILDLKAKSDAFDEAASKFPIPKTVSVA